MDAYLVYLLLDSEPHDTHQVDEFIGLVHASDHNVIDCITYRIRTIHPGHLLGAGQIKSLCQQIESTPNAIIVFNQDLALTHRRNIAKISCRTVIDRTEMILTIFEKRARSFEGKLQVALAQQTHLLNSLVGGWTHLERQRGGIGLRGGPGEKQLENDRRLVNQRISQIRKRLVNVQRQRAQRMQHRRKKRTANIALVGYTNAGKSSLFNALTQAEVAASDAYFMTLDPTSRRCQLTPSVHVVLSDTVGFIRDLPDGLVSSFKATLEEITRADILCHVVDANDPRMDEKIASVRQIIAEMGADDIQEILVLNKIDQLDAREVVHGLEADCCVSAATHEGIEALKVILAARIETTHEQLIFVAYSAPHHRARLHQRAVVYDEWYDNQGWWCHVRATQDILKYQL